MRTVLILLAAASPAFAQALDYDTIRLDVDKVDSIDTVDLNADDRPDIVITAGRSAKIFLFKPGAGFARAPDRTIQFGPDVYLWTAARFADAPGLQLAVFSSRGIQRFARTGPADWSAAEDLIVAPNLFRGHAQADAAPLRLDFLRDLDGDGLADAIYFMEEALWFFTQEKDGAGRPRFRLKQKLPLAGEAELKTGWAPHHKLTQTVMVPLLVVGDVNEDKRPDLMYLRRESVGQFIQREDGRFDAPKEGSLAERKKARRQYLKFEAPPRIADFNGDGALDVAIPDSYRFQARVEVHFNRRGRPDFTMPDAVLKVEDAWSSGIYVEDLDGDGKPEIIQGVIPKFGVIGGIETFLSGKITVELHFHRLEKGTFLNKPVQQVGLKIPYTFQATTDSAVADLKFWPQLKADLDGDGFKDLIVGKDENSLAVHFGRKDTLVAAEAKGTISLQPPADTISTKTHVADFNGDGRSDLVIRFETAGKMGSVVDVKLSRKP
ncbi:MAG TPA: VCBS repeat-containing protein [Planctomycetota bacterium]|nr:VCBS repeat-containing protein [Planctomycetota bacterium]